jgi:tripartite-type tricarboxylate transporter receptor subunit TctC
LKALAADDAPAMLWAMTPALLRRTALGLAAAAGATAARGQTIIPDGTIDVLVGFQSTGGPDVIARRIAAELERGLGRRVVVENRSGSAGALPGRLLQRQPADGTTLALMASTSFVARLVERDFPFDPIADLAPITMVGTWPIGLAVSPRTGVTSFAEYLGWLKAGGPERARIGNLVPDAFIEAFDRLLSREFGVSVRGAPVPGAGAMVNELADGAFPAVVAGLTSLLEHHRGRRLRLLMTTGPERSAVAPDVPTARELGLSRLQIVEWYGFFARSGTPQPLIEEWNRRIGAVLRNPALAGELEQMGLEIAPSTPEELAMRLSRHLKEWETHFDNVGLKPVR